MSINNNDTNSNSNTSTTPKQDSGQNMNVKPADKSAEIGKTVKDDKGNYKTAEPVKVAPAK